MEKNRKLKNLNLMRTKKENFKGVFHVGFIKEKKRKFDFYIQSIILFLY